ncbi:hypothetical protein E3O37_35310 [Burkholderia pseudomallei]|nr:hypothetical protein E3O37_35310 [Burkholderia pseudomallei]
MRRLGATATVAKLASEHPPPAAGRACRVHEAPIASLCPARDADAASKPTRHPTRPRPEKKAAARLNRSSS